MLVCTPKIKNRVWKIPYYLTKLIILLLLVPYTIFLNWSPNVYTVPSNPSRFKATITSAAAAAAAKSLQSCPTLCNPIDRSPPGSTIPGIPQARTLEWVAISFSNAGKWKVKGKSLSRVRLSATHGLQPTRHLHPWDSPSKSTGVGCHCLLRKCV